MRVEVNVREVKAATLKLSLNGIKGVSTLSWVIVRETATASYTCPVLFLCLNLIFLLEEKSRDNEDTNWHWVFTRPVTRIFYKVSLLGTCLFQLR
jgi:hypothetical protein